MWWKTALIVLGAAVAIVIWAVLASLFIPGDATGPYIARFVLSFLVGLGIGCIAFVVWDEWTDNDRY